MIPLFAVFRFKNSPLGGWRLWIPLFIVWILLLPFLLLITPFFFLSCLITWVPPFRLVGILWEMMTALRGLQIEIDHEQWSMDITLR